MCGKKNLVLRNGKSNAMHAIFISIHYFPLKSANEFTVEMKREDNECISFPYKQQSVKLISSNYY